MTPTLPKTQTAAIVNKQGGPVTFDHNYPVPEPKEDELLVKVLYTGVCQSDLHTKNGTATGADGKPITNIKLPHVGGHEGVGRIISLGPTSSASPSSEDKIKVGALVGIRFVSRVCQSCDYCESDREQHCKNQTNHLHHEDGSFQEYCVLDRKNLAVLPDEIDPKLAGPVLCAGVTAYKAVVNSRLREGDILAVLGAGGGLGHLAGKKMCRVMIHHPAHIALVQFGLAVGARVIGIDVGKHDFVTSLGAEYAEVSSAVQTLQSLGGAHAVVVTSGHPKAYQGLGDMLRVGGSLSMVGIPPGDVCLDIPVATIIIKGLKIEGNLVGSLKEAMEAIELLRLGKIAPHVEVLTFNDLPIAYERLERGDVLGRIVLKIGD